MRLPVASNSDRTPSTHRSVSTNFTRAGAIDVTVHPVEDSIAPLGILGSGSTNGIGVLGSRQQCFSQKRALVRR